MGPLSCALLSRARAFGNSFLPTVLGDDAIRRLAIYPLAAFALLAAVGCHEDEPEPEPVCGNLVVEDGEICDGINLAGAVCPSVAGGFDGGALACSDDCTAYVTDACTTCGDAAAEGDEVCDGTDLGVATCATVDGSFDGGALHCLSDCSGYDTSACTACGDWRAEGVEVCDNGDLDGATCASIGQGFDGGDLGCKADCLSFDTSLCTDCGDGAAEYLEVCDTTDLGGLDCATLGMGFDGGMLDCLTDCSDFDVAACFVLPPEWLCDPGYYGVGDGCDCGCGAVDPDCADETAASCSWCADDGACMPGACPSWIDPADNATCMPFCDDPVHQWSLGTGGSHWEAGEGVAFDEAGNLYATGYFSDTINLGGTDLMADSSLPDFYLAKYDADGNHVWSRRYGGQGWDYASDIDVDATGRIAIAGGYDIDFALGSSTLENTGFEDYLVAVFDADGNPIWAHGFGTMEEEWYPSVSFDGEGNVLVAAYARRPIDFGAGEVPVQGDVNAFLVKYDPNGVLLWSRVFGGSDYSLASAVAVGPDDAIYLAGSFTGRLDLGGTDLVQVGSSTTVYVAAFDPDGRQRWSEAFGGDPYSNEVLDIGVDDRGEVTATGLYGATMVFGDTEITAIGLADTFVVHFDGEGHPRWARSYGDAGSTLGAWLSVARSGEIAVTGRFTGTWDFGGFNLTADGNDDLFLVLLDSEGTYLRGLHWGVAGSTASGRAVALLPDGRVALSGLYSGPTMNLGGSDLTGHSNSDLFIAVHACEP